MGAAPAAPPLRRAAARCGGAARSARPRARPRPRTGAACGAAPSGADFWALLAAPAAAGVAGAYWLASQQPPVRAGDIRDRMVEEERARKEEARAAAEAEEAESAPADEGASSPVFAADAGEFGAETEYSLGEPVRVLMGAIDSSGSGEGGGEGMQRATVRVRRRLQQPSALVVAELPRKVGQLLDLAPCGPSGEFAVVRGVDERLTAAALAAGSGDASSQLPRAGDVLLAATTPALAWSAASRASVRAPRRVLTLHAAPEGGFDAMLEAVRAPGAAADGPLTLVLERQPQP